MNKIGYAVLVATAAAACSKGGDTKATVALGQSGFVVDIPSDWKVETPMAGFYEFKGGRGAPQVMESPIGVGSVDDAVKGHCEGRTDIQKGTLPTGFWLTCKGESQMIKGVTTTQILVRVAKDDKSSFDCHLETDRDPELALGICKSIRKK